MSARARRFAFRLLAIGVFSLSIAVAFLVGFELGQGGAQSHSATVMSVDSLRAALVKERDSLKRLLRESEQQRLILEQGLQIDQEATRLLKEELKAAQDARLELNRELTYLKRLVQGQGEGAVQVYDMRLVEGENAREFHYSFTIAQLNQGFGRSTGDVSLGLLGLRGDVSATLALTDLPAAEPSSFKMDFEHFQNCQGMLRIPEGFEPQSVVVDIKPRTRRLLPTSVAFAWETQPR